MLSLVLLATELAWATCVIVALTVGPAKGQTADQVTVTATMQTEHRRPTWQERFASANTTHDGRLTMEQARSGYKTIAKHFDEIDRSHKGYVTEQDVGAWREATREKRRARKEATQDPLRPRNAYQRTQGDQPGAATTQVIGPLASPAIDDAAKPAD